jgi:hypothetical protein
LKKERFKSASHFGMQILPISVWNLVSKKGTGTFFILISQIANLTSGSWGKIHLRRDFICAMNHTATHTNIWLNGDWLNRFLQGWSPAYQVILQSLIPQLNKIKINFIPTLSIKQLNNCLSKKT